MKIPDFMANTWEPPEYQETEEFDEDAAYQEKKDREMEEDNG